MDRERFTKQHTQIAKGFAIILMLFDHLFWMDYGKYTSIFPKLPDGHSLEWAIGSIGNICVAMFLMLSGYGMYIVANRKDKYSIKDSLIRIRNVWLDYAVITIVFILFDLFFGKIKFEPIKIILNIFALDYTYNRFAWFMIVYIVIMLVFPLIHYIFKNIKWWGEVLVIVGIKVGITAFNMLLNRVVNVPEVLYKTMIEPFMLIPVFLIGYLIAKYKLFELIYKKIFDRKTGKLLLALVMLIVIVLMYYFQYTILDHITAPILCFTIAYLCSGNKTERLMEFLGNQSEYIWLVHYPIMVLLLNKIVYYPKYSIIIFIWLLIITVTISVMYSKIKYIIQSKVKKKGTVIKASN